MASSVPPLLPGENAPGSLVSRLFNVFATPGEVFEGVKAGPPVHANWWVPLLLSCVAGLVYVFVVFSQESVLRQVREQQVAAIQKSMPARSRRTRASRPLRPWSSSSVQR
jgi:hypothetical protein